MLDCIHSCLQEQDTHHTYEIFQETHQTTSQQGLAAYVYTPFPVIMGTLFRSYSKAGRPRPPRLSAAVGGVSGTDGYLPVYLLMHVAAPAASPTSLLQMAAGCVGDWSLPRLW